MDFKKKTLVEILDIKKNTIINFVYTYMKKLDQINIIEEFDSDFSDEEEILCDSDFECD